MRLENTQKVLEAFKNFVIQQSRSRLTKAGKKATGDLYNQLEGQVKEMQNSILVKFDMPYYGKFQDKGVSGTKQKYNTPFSYGSKMPPIKALADWAKLKNIRLRDSKGKYTKGNYNTIGFLFARSIQKKGIKPSLFFTKPFEQGFEKLPKELIEAFGLDIEDFFDYTLKK